MENGNIITSHKTPALAELPKDELCIISFQIIKLLHRIPLVYSLEILRLTREFLINSPVVDVNSPRLLAIQTEYNFSDLQKDR